MLLPSGGKLGTCKIVQLLIFFLFTSNSHLQAIKMMSREKEKKSLIHKLLKNIAFLAFSSVTKGEYFCMGQF